MSRSSSRFTGSLPSVTSASNYNGVSYSLLEERRVDFLLWRKVNESIPNLKKIVDKLQGFGVSFDMEILKDALNKEYDNENAFDMGWFKAIKNAFDVNISSCDLVHSDASQIVWSLTYDKDGQQHQLFIGLARQLRRKSGFQPNHAVAIFERVVKDGMDVYVVVHLLAVMELKAQNSPMTMLDFPTNQRGQLLRPDLRAEHGPLGQEIFYTLNEVWPDLCNCGLQPSNIPLVVLVAKQRKPAQETKSEDGRVEKKNDGIDGIQSKEGFIVNKGGDLSVEGGTKRRRLTSQVRWAVGKLVPAEECCEKFAYGVLNFGTFESEQPNLRGGLERAIAAYLYPILFGFQLVINHIFSPTLNTDGNPIKNVPLNYPVSGRVLMVAGEQLYPSASVHLIATASRSGRSSNAIKVSQGDLFEGSIASGTLQAMYKATSHDKNYFWFSDAFPGIEGSELDTMHQVIIKASSLANYRQLIPHRSVLAALQAIQLNADANLKEQLKQVFIVICIRPGGLITIMKDLRTEDYEVLRPSKLIGNKPLRRALKPLWMAQRNLAEQVLLPIARFDVVQCDIRPGFEETSNILVKKTSDGLHLALIDAESFVPIIQLSNNLIADGRFVPPQDGANAIRYLWWQCLRLAYVWTAKTTQDNLRRDMDELMSEIASLTDETNEELREESEVGEHVNLLRFLLADKELKSLMLESTVDKSTNDLNLLLRKISDFFG